LYQARCFNLELACIRFLLFWHEFLPWLSIIQVWRLYQIGARSENAAEALGKIGDTSAVLSLIQALSYDDDSVRRTAAKALRQIGSGAVPRLIEILGTTEGDVRRHIHTLRKQIGTPEAMSAINTKSRR